MSITYEEALSTLMTMFGPPWTDRTLDAVLRHHDGHMENTVESVLSHGNKDPQLLLIELRNLKLDIENQKADDEKLARELAKVDDQVRIQSSIRGIDIKLWSHIESLRSSNHLSLEKERTEISNQHQHDLSIFSEGDKSVVNSDEAMARILQDELFSQELQKNPKFSYLDRSRGNFLGERIPSVRDSNSICKPFSDRIQEKPGIMDIISDMGESAKRKLSLLASRLNKKYINQYGVIRINDKNKESEIESLLYKEDVEHRSTYRSRESDLEMRPIRSPCLTRDKKRD